MKTKELIEQLQKEDPSGELHIRINGMMPIFAEKKPGYYDGFYQYQEGDKIIISTQGEKVDIITLDLEGWVWEHFNDWQNRIEFKHLNQDSITELIIRLSKIAEEASEFDKHSVQEFSGFIMDKIKDGYKVIQEDTDVGKHNTMFFIKPDSKIKLRQGDCHAIIRGSFKPIKKEGYIEWQPK